MASVKTIMAGAVRFKHPEPATVPEFARIAGISRASAQALIRLGVLRIVHDQGRDKIHLAEYNRRHEG
ncbi:MAG TPA: hypothetical protein VJX68_06395 [Candidatus Binatus sp.]|uniref:hypothetical protein n=1 Tax=Candidatus Binatus sp. TaxID=2811406 RepID=UPI002B475DF9|nr:hypothetical protein [Candidatus Binatus sp.]HKN12811.1 hypothetical protein [Candidatus Binatus sp.]